MRVGLELNLAIMAGCKNDVTNHDATLLRISK